VFGEAPINCRSASFPSRQIETFHPNKLFIRAVEAHQWGCNCLEWGFHMPVAAGMCLTDDLIDRMWRNQTKFHSRLSIIHQILLQNRHELSLYNIRIALMSTLANWSISSTTERNILTVLTTWIPFLILIPKLT
jgi:hypothetical protein